MSGSMWARVCTIFVLAVGLGHSEGARAGEYRDLRLTLSVREMIVFGEDTIFDLVLESPATQSVPDLVGSQLRLTIDKLDDDQVHYERYPCGVRSGGETAPNGIHSPLGSRGGRKTVDLGGEGFRRGQVSVWSEFQTRLGPGRYLATVVYEGVARTNASFMVVLDYERSVSILLDMIESYEPFGRRWAAAAISDILGQPMLEFADNASQQSIIEKVAGLRKWWLENRGLILLVEARSKGAGRPEMICSDSAHLPAGYLCVNLSGGTNATNYPVADYADATAVPGGVTSDTYKTTHLLMRYIPAGVIPKLAHMSQRIVLSQGYYMGVYEVTQRQWELVTGTRPSHFKGSDALPVESVSYNDIRGARYGGGWPVSSGVDGKSFIGRLRARTGNQGLDLPTEGQLEYACRAQTWGSYNDGSDNPAGAGRLGWFMENSEQQTHIVGLKTPNAWGLYDMHGNVAEICLDWHMRKYPSSEFDPRGGPNELLRVVRGGAWNIEAGSSTSARGGGGFPAGSYAGQGLRVASKPQEP